MNEFQICGDSVHLLAFIILIRKICINQSSAGISGKSQVLLFTVFVCRYADLLKTYISLYNTLFKVIFILLSLFTIYLIYGKFYKTYKEERDSFWIRLLLPPVLVLSLFVNYITLNVKTYDIMDILRQYIRNPFEVLWTFSIYLEAVAIIPQYHMIVKTGNGQNVLYYILALTIYRGLYVCNWIYRYTYQNHLDLISSCSGLVQTILLIVVLISILMCKEKRPNWREITEVFTIESAKIGPEKFQSAKLRINQPQVEDLTIRLLPEKH